MNIDIIERAIQELEVAEETVENIEELASLYIVREYMYSSDKAKNSPDNRASLSYYNRYVSSKKRYQLKQTTEGEVIQDMKNTCKELRVFIENLYSNTDMNKERICIRQMLQSLYEEFCN